jgi:ADP-ribose pyrophosphatase
VLALPDADGVRARDLAMPALQVQARLLRRRGADELRRAAGRRDDPLGVIERLGSREVYRNNWMRVREDEVRFSGGATGIYGVVEKPDFALVVPLDGGHLWLVEQYRYPVGDRFWEFPQGSWEDAALQQLPPEELARAELAEETGLHAERMTHLGHLYEAYGFSNQGFDVFVAEGLSRRERRPTPSEQDMVVASY